MKIALLDRCTLTQNDISFDEIERLGEVKYYDILTSEQIIEACRDCEILLCNKANIDSYVMQNCTELKYIGLFATGYNNIDIEYAARRGIVVCNVPDYSTSSVAQLTVSLLLMLATNSHKYNESVHNGEWIRSHTFSYFPYPILELDGKTLGIVGCGRIGQRVGRIAASLGMNVVYNSRTEKAGYRFLPLDELCRVSDFISLHCPLTKENEHMICEKTLLMMKSSAFLINTARGGLVNERDLRYALDNDIIAGAALDVLTNEPMSEDNILLGAKNCIITPHVAWASYASRLRLIKEVAQNISSYLSGYPKNNVAK